jgi:hypothetical protein
MPCFGVNGGEVFLPESLGDLLPGYQEPRGGDVYRDKLPNGRIYIE